VLNKHFLYKHFLIIFFLLGLSGITFGQPDPISTSQFYEAYRTSLALKDKSSWRTIHAEVHSWNGKVTTTREITESISPQMSRWIRTETRDGKSTTAGQISIGGFYYCRENRSPWKKSVTRCGRTSFRGIPADNKSSCTVEDAIVDGLKAKLYQNKSTYKDFDGVERFLTDKFWLNEEGRIIREESAIGAALTNEITNHYTVTYEYNPPGLRIAAPIK
jgi:hypothetical protein